VCPWSCPARRARRRAVAVMGPWSRRVARAPSPWSWVRLRLRGPVLLPRHARRVGVGVWSVGPCRGPGGWVIHSPCRARRAASVLPTPLFLQVIGGVCSVHGTLAGVQTCRSGGIKACSGPFEPCCSVAPPLTCGYSVGTGDRAAPFPKTPLHGPLAGVQTCRSGDRKACSTVELHAFLHGRAPLRRTAGQVEEIA
jgi:hypothetical protein